MAVSDIPLQQDFDDTLALIKKLRADVREQPILDNGQGGIMTNPAYVLLANMEIHLRGLARLIGPLNVERQMAEEFQESSELARELMQVVTEAPIVDGQRHARTRNPHALILTYTQTHIRGCAAILAIAKSVVVGPGGDAVFHKLFTEPSGNRS